MTYLKLIAFSLFLGCGSSNSEKASNESDNLIELLVIDTIAFDDLTKMEGDSVNKNYYMNSDQLHTGLAVTYEMANDGKWSFVYTFNDGIMERLDVFGINGYQHRFVEMKNGYEHHTVMFHRNGNRYLESFYDKERKKTGIWSKWHESGKLDWSKNYN